MELFIRLENGQPVDHPILKENFQQVFPNIDINNLPDDYAVFQRVEAPQLGTYEVIDHTAYGWDGGVVKNVYVTRAMTEEEKIAKQNEVKRWWAERGYPSWTFDESTCSFKAPIECPQDGKPYAWNEEQMNWMEVVLQQ